MADPVALAPALDRAPGSRPWQTRQLLTRCAHLTREQPVQTDVLSARGQVCAGAAVVRCVPAPVALGPLGTHSTAWQHPSARPRRALAHPDLPRASQMQGAVSLRGLGRARPRPVPGIGPHTAERRRRRWHAAAPAAKSAPRGTHSARNKPIS